jgi:hypothetical protein
MSARTAILFVLAAAISGSAASAVALADGADGSPAAGAEEAPSIETALWKLRSLYTAQRESAVAELIAAGPSARPRVVAAFRAGDPDTRPLLVRVLAADASKEALDALLAALPDASDPGTSSAIQASLVEHAERVTDAVRNWHDASGNVPPRVAELVYLLDRARVESLFLAKKSESGGTGSYPGQFDDLKPYRRLALDVCLGILINRAPKIPGRYPAGSYRFLRPPPFFVDQGELRGMATHAISELALPTDDDVVRELIALRDDLERIIAEKISRDRERGRQNAAFEQALSNGVLATLAKLRPDDDVPGPGEGAGFTWLEFANAKVDELRGRFGDLDEAAALALQLGQFDKAVDLYRMLLHYPNQGALAYYNLACAYARWSLDPGRKSAASLREDAIDAIETAVVRGYADWSWMEQDGDLKPIRGEPAFRTLVERMKARFPPKPAKSLKPSTPPTPAQPGSPPNPPMPAPVPTPEHPR